MGKPKIPVGKSNGFPSLQSVLQAFPAPVRWESWDESVFCPSSNFRAVSGSETLATKASAIPFYDWGDAIFLLFLVCSVDLDILCSRSFSHHVKFLSFYAYAQDFHPGGTCVKMVTTPDGFVCVIWSICLNRWCNWFRLLSLSFPLLTYECRTFQSTKWHLISLPLVVSWSIKTSKSSSSLLDMYLHRKKSMMP